MIYTLPFQSDELFQSDFFKLRKMINPESDIIYFLVKIRHNEDLSTEHIYKKILQLDGKFRTDTNNWLAPKVKIRVINQNKKNHF